MVTDIKNYKEDEHFTPYINVKFVTEQKTTGRGSSSKFGSKSRLKSAKSAFNLETRRLDTLKSHQSNNTFRLNLDRYRSNDDISNHPSNRRK